MENANPTIHLISDLPTRRRSSSSESKEDPRGVLASVLPPETIWDPLDEADQPSSDSELDDTPEPIDEQEIYDLIATMSDPEHPLSLGSLAVVNLPDIHIAPLSKNPASRLRQVEVLLTPTVNHCSLATVIGLGVRVRLEQALSPRFRVDVKIKEGTHASADDVNKQLGDKERVAAALENNTLWGLLRKMMETCV